jgi:transcription-repair coupling factor (superfamily II helicase)
MISLFINRISTQLAQFPPFQDLVRRYRQGPYPVAVEGLQGGILSLVVDRLAREGAGSLLIVVPTEREAENLVGDLGLFADGSADGPADGSTPMRPPAPPVVQFPWWGVLPYGNGQPLPAVFGERARLLARLLSGERLVVVASLRAALGHLPDPDHLRRHTLSLREGDALDLTAVGRSLDALGYLRVPRVSLKGEYALRGEVVDVFPFGEEEAIRLVLDFDTLAEIRRFDPISQASTGRLPAIALSPGREVVLSGETLATLRARLGELTPDPGAAEEAVEALLRRRDGGVELYFPLCFPRSWSLLDYMGGESGLCLVDLEQLEGSFVALRKEYLELYRQARSRGRLVPGPRQILLDFPALVERHPRQVLLHSLKGGTPGRRSLAAGAATGDGADGRIRIASEPPRSFFGNIAFLREELENLLTVGYRITIFAEYEHQAERIRQMLKDLPVEVLPHGISSGFSVPGLKIMVIEESEIFGRKKRIPRSVGRVKSQAIDTFVELTAGDYVVHVNYGIGIFRGIERILAAGHERDYIHLEYAEGEKVYIPIEQVNLIQRYIGQEEGVLRLDRIGGKSWENKKNRVKRSVEDLAQRLVRLYSRRRAAHGFAFPPDTDWQAEFEAGFPYQETEDQLRAIEEVKLDMESPVPMDRLVVGDVGYGKTEVALRAAFKAVTGGKQVAVLAPTTILVEQHYETFQERFRRFPVRIDMLSRFRSRAGQKRVIQAAREGAADIVIGTHRLLQKDVAFKNLGLLVVDEEQRFGVGHKERLKELKTTVDCLTMTATPIPRTLHMSLMKIRDMSTINTPPQNRLPIETFIEEFNEEVIAEAVRREVARGGQVFYLHNRVQTIPYIHGFLTRLLPGITIDVAHGQMDEEDLEDVMHRFVHGGFQVLLSTTIIENGLDIPNVNTIVIDRADTFGIAQLYQLRGRVGRSDRPAYAYLMVPEDRVLSELPMKRLKIISDFTELGSGFKIALKDLEIRGAGNLLGREQHGDILAVGYDMYIRLLDEAIAGLHEEKPEEAPEPYLELEYSGFIPDSYIQEPMEKMAVYKKISSITIPQELDRVQQEVEDRFGPPPDEVQSIFSIAEIRIICRRLFISSLKERKGVVTVEFSRLSNLSVERVLQLIRESGERVFLDPARPNCLLIRTGRIGLKDKAVFLSERLSRLL